MKALLIGGAGPTGPHIAQGLAERGYQLTLMNRGLHTASGLPPHQHIIGDPHFRETIDEALRGHEFDVVIASYGRVRHIAEALAGRCKQFISIGGMPSYLGSFAPWKLRPFGCKIPSRESENFDWAERDAEDRAVRFGKLVWEAEERVIDLSDQGAFSGSHFRFPRIYGPRQGNPPEWGVIKRVLDGRKHIILRDGGLEILSRCAALNAAQFILLALDNAEAAKGQIFNCADDDQFTTRQVLEMVLDIMGSDAQMYSLPDRLAKPALAFSPLQSTSTHCLFDTTKARDLLGYRDVISAEQALREAVTWLLANPIDSEAYKIRDPLDYAGEDRLIAAYEKAIAEVELTAPFETPPPMHPYPHPKTPGLGLDHKGR